MIGFGFSYVGLIFLVMLFIPNIVWANNKPADYDKYVNNENKVLLFLERSGEVLVSAIALISGGMDIRISSLWIWWLAAAFVLMVLYELYWIRYFRSGKTMADMYSSYAGFPVAGASLPVIAFLFLGIYGSNIFLIVSAVILGIGHIGIHLAHRREAGVTGPERSALRTVLTVIKVLILIPAVIIIAVSSYFIAARNYNYLTNLITGNGIEEQTYVEINGQKQFITIRGKDKDAPVILYLHGGPLSPDSSMDYVFSNHLIDEYVFVNWDQRGCGRTYLANGDRDNTTVSFDQAADDLDKLVDYLCGRFGKDKVIIMGHSYGSLLGSRYAYEHPSRVTAYIGIGQFINNDAALKAEYEDALRLAREQGDDTSAMTAAYDKYLQQPSLEASSEVSGYASAYHPAPRSSNNILAALRSPYMASDDAKWLTKILSFDDFVRMSGPLVDTLMTADLFTTQPSYEVPVLFITGGCDWNCSYPVMVEYADLTGSEYKIIDGCGHYVHADAPREFAAAVKEFLQKPVI